METESKMVTTPTIETFKNNPLKEKGLGPRLKSARDHLKLTEKEAAQRLHLNPSIITLIENENFEDGPPATFMRGYIRSYAKLLNLPDSEINSSFSDLDTLNVQPPATTQLPFVKSRGIYNYYRYIRSGTYVIAAGLAGLVVLWWVSHPREMSLKTFINTVLVEIFLGYSDKHSGIMAQLYVFEN